MSKPIKEHCRRCPRCAEPLRTVFVHGHEQCVTCDQVIYDCCQGECYAEAKPSSQEPEATPI